MLPKKVLLPVVKRGVALLDELMLQYAGPIGVELSEDEFAIWLSDGRTRPSDLRHYAERLAAQLDDPHQRKNFLDDAQGLLFKLQSGFIEPPRR